MGALARLWHTDHGIALDHHCRSKPGWQTRLCIAFWVLPLVMVVYLALEFILDYWLKFNFRQTTWLGSYLLVYYLALFAMIGYAFLTSKAYGFITLITYFINLAATFYSYARVGHGV